MDLIAAAPTSSYAPLVLIAIGFVGGLLVGWNLLPQPAWVGRIFGRKK